MSFILKPTAPLLSALILFSIALLVYDVNATLSIQAALTIFALTCVAIILIVTSSGRPLQPRSWRLPFSNYLASILIFSALTEYVIFGIPLLGGSLYTEFGLPIIHHLSVSTWYLVFIAKGIKRKALSTLLLCISVINPILMLNRDCLLLSLFSIYALSELSRKKGFSWSAPIFLSIIFIGFGVLGDIRSPGAIRLVDLPFRFETSEIPSSIFWLLVYTTSSIFNMINNIDHLSLDLYYDYSNVFPEYYLWASRTGMIFGIALYWLCVSFALNALKKKAWKSFGWYPLYTYFLYQTYMSSFSGKFFTTNAIATLVLLIPVATAYRSGRASADRSNKPPKGAEKPVLA